MNTFRNLPGTQQPSWIFVVPTSCPRMAHCHPTDFSSGTHNLYDSAKQPTNHFQVHKMATRLLRRLSVTTFLWVTNSCQNLDCRGWMTQRWHDADHLMVQAYCFQTTPSGRYEALGLDTSSPSHIQTSGDFIIGRIYKTSSLQLTNIATCTRVYNRG